MSLKVAREHADFSLVESRLHREQRGFTLVETLVSVFVLLLGLMAVVAMIDAANATTRSNKAREGGTNLARELVESARSIRYPRLSQAFLESDLRARPALAGTGPGWRIERRGLHYTVNAASVCTLDDPSDGTGSHAAGGYCADSAAAGTSDAKPDDYKRITIEVTWEQGSGSLTVRQSSLVNNPGGASGPAVAKLDMTAPFSAADPPPPLTDATVSQASFRATTSAIPARVEWSVDG
ncbi:MAG: prepilin-type N-terminal cleavage/methylation domain-containing protein, partial [Actinomycetota bacterium]|nr:prepilin-type N-terminal cleavage/methylation domain-containing protein [Actinomycetota bacterium]